MKLATLPDQKTLNSLFSYNPDTGELRRKIDRVSRRGRAGEIAGTVMRCGYRRVSVKSEHYLAHRLIAVIVFGDVVGGRQIDHANGDRSDCRLANLRFSTHAQNGQNKEFCRSNTGCRGVSYVAAVRRYIATIHRDGRRVWSKSFKSLEDAVATREAIIGLYHGDFAYTNRRLLNDARSGELPETTGGAPEPSVPSSPDGRVAP